MSDINQLLETSIAIYSEVGTLYSGLLQRPLNTVSPNNINSNNTKISSLLAEAQKIDTEIGIELLEIAEANREPISVLLEQRKLVLSKLTKVNTTLVAKASSVASLLKHEVGKYLKRERRKKLPEGERRKIHSTA